VGFWGKFTLFSSVFDLVSLPTPDPARPIFVFFAVVGVLNAAVAAAYYLRIVAAMYFREGGTPALASTNAGARLSVFAAAVLVVAIGILPGSLSRASERAALRFAEIMHASTASVPQIALDHGREDSQALVAHDMRSPR
jgi:NADH-quinone oxidoreductase subunit N